MNASDQPPTGTTPADPKHEFKGVWICAALWEDTELNPTEKFLIAEVDSLCGNGKACFASNEFLSKRVQTTARYMNNMLYGLTQARYLEPFAMLWITLALKEGYGRDFAFKLLTRA